MATEKSTDLKPQGEAIAAFATRMSEDQNFANEFASAVKRKDEKRTVELAKQSVAADVASAVEIHPAVDGICICYKGICLCLILR